MKINAEVFNIIDFEKGTNTIHFTEEALIFKIMIKNSIGKEIRNINYAELKTTIHTIKGISIYGGLNRMYRVCVFFENYYTIYPIKTIKKVLLNEYRLVINNNIFID
ncbi:hypothetical protein [Aliivibrio fischeri]|uniref:hypothetical protein n=1 Tax=Aliivibrio fischeri TaxID=668 RepID=UPI00084C008E|nr:hypothetical protein [Aliivibrio fischeri]OED58165.1 hypothetical protein BEI47_01195 [Aliivibrio fischeri]